MIARARRATVLALSIVVTLAPALLIVVEGAKRWR